MFDTVRTWLFLASEKITEKVAVIWKKLQGQIARLSVCARDQAQVSSEPEYVVNVLVRAAKVFKHGVVGFRQMFIFL